jgi:Domain of Unknown Function (DUF1080)
MKRLFAFLFLSLFFSLCSANSIRAQNTQWKIHDLNRPVPVVVTPGTASTQDSAGKAPSDAISLFDGHDLSQWLDKDNGPAKWKVENGYFEVVAKTGPIHTKKSFGDCQLHLEFSEPVPPKGESQERGNSGVFLMGLYEIQVLDSYENKTYADGQAAAVYGQYPPLVNASRPPGQWQSYDIIFHAPNIDSTGKVLKTARVTVFHNGVLVQDNVEIHGRTAVGDVPTYVAGPDKAPLELQDHGNPVRYRNIWIRPLIS